MKKVFITILVLLALFVFHCPSHAAIVLLNDNFNSENGGTGALNYNTFTNWTVTDGTVDLIGNNFYDFYPGNGLYVDLDGSTNNAGILKSILVFSPGTYLLEFNLGGNASSGSDIVDVALGIGVGNWSTTFNLPYNAGFTTQSFQFTTSVTGPLTFSNQGGDNIGAILDNVKVSAVPIPPSVWLLGSGLVGLYGIRRRFTIKQK